MRSQNLILSFLNSTTLEVWGEIPLTYSITMKNRIFYIPICLILFLQCCKENPIKNTKEGTSTSLDAEIIDLTKCNCKTAELIIDKHSFQVSDTITIHYLVNTLENLDTIKDDGRIIFGDTIIFNCHSNFDLLVLVNQDYIKFNNQKYKPDSKLKWELRKLEGEATVRKGIKRALSNLESTTELSLRDCSLDSIPSEIFKLRNLEFLDLSLNLIKKLPDEIGELQNLRELSISYNLLDHISPEISQLKNLENLWLLDNELNSIPYGICDLSKLKELNLNGNKIQELPNCIPKMDSLERLFIGTWEQTDQSKKLIKQVEKFKLINEKLTIQI